MLTFRYARETDADLLFEWANESVTRENSYNNAAIEYEDHIQWFAKRINSDAFYCYIFSDEGQLPVGQVRIEKQHDKNKKDALISVSIDKDHRGKGYSVEMLRKASEDFLHKNKGYVIAAYIFKENEASFKGFLKAGYGNLKEAVIKNIPSYILSFSKENSEGH